MVSRSARRLLRSALVLAVLATAAAADGLEPVVVLSPAGSSALEALAAREVRRYFYVRTGRLLPIQEDAAGPAIVVGGRDRESVRALADAGLAGRLDGLALQERLLVTVRRPGRTVLLVTGGDDAGVLYAAYRLAEHLGVRFYLHGDVIPDERRSPALPELDETGRPLFAVAGHPAVPRLPRGARLVEPDDYKAILGQLPKLGMNFFGLHTYPEGGRTPSRRSGSGLADEIGEGRRGEGRLPLELPSRPLRGNWGYAAKTTATTPSARAGSSTATTTAPT